MSGSKEKEVFSQKCATCGGDLVFNPKKQMLECVQCGNLLSIDTQKTSEKNFENLLKSAPTWQNETAVYVCEHCGAKLVTSNNKIATRCDYCGASQIVRVDELPGIKPDTIAVFKVTKEEAMSRAKQWLSKRFFAPRWYKKTVEPDSFHGIYYPTFTFDALTNSHYHGTEVITQTRTVYRDGQPVTQAHISRRPISGTISKTFDDLLVPAATNIAEDAFNSLQPFDTNNASVYKKEFLSGFSASHYTKDAMQCWGEAKSKMDSAIRRDIERRYTGLIEGLSVNTTMANITYKYALLPLYVGHSRSQYDKKQYDVFVNGQSGKVYGKSPVSVGKVLLTTALGLAAVAAGIIFAMFL